MIGFSEDNFEKKDGKWVARMTFDFDLDDPDELAQAIGLAEIARHFVGYNTRIDNGLECHIAAFKVLEQRTRERLADVKEPTELPTEGQVKP